MIETCTECSQDFITEADPYGVWRRPNKTHVTCGKCFIQLIEPMRLERIKQLEDALRDMGAALEWFNKEIDGMYDERGLWPAREALSRNAKILDTINKRGEE